MKLHRGIAAGVLAIGLSFSALPSFATVLTLDGGWSSFTFEGVGSAWSDDFSFTIADASWLAVTDAYLSGDRFEFFANDVSLGLTSMPTAFNTQIGGNFDAAFADSGWSSAEVNLAAGTYLIRGETVLSPFGAGGAGIRLSSQSLGGPPFESVPAPSVAMLVLAGLLGLASTRRKIKAA